MSSPYTKKKKLEDVEKELHPVLSLGFKKHSHCSVQHLDNDEQIIYQVGHHLDIYNYSRGSHKIISKGEKIKEICSFYLGKKYLAVCEETVKGNYNDRFQISLFNHGMDQKYRILHFGSEEAAECMSFSRNSQFFSCTTFSPGNNLFFWDLDKNKIITERTFKLNILEIQFNKFQKTGSPLSLSVLHEIRIRIFFFIDNELKSSEPIRNNSPSHSFQCHEWYDFEKLLVGTKGGNILIVVDGVITKTIKSVFLSPGCGIHTICLVERGFVCGGDKGYFSFFERSYDKNYFMQYKLIQTNYNVRISGICCSKREDNIICCCEDNSLLFLNFNNIDIIKENEDNFERLPVEFHSEVVIDTGISFQKSLILTVTKNHVHLWNYIKKKIELRKKIDSAINGGICSASIHPNGMEILLAFNDRIILNKILNENLYPVHDWVIRNCSCVKYSNGGHLFASCNGSRIILISSVTYNKIIELEGHDGIIRDILWGKKDQIISSCGDDGTIFIWRVFKKSQKLAEDTVKFRQNHTKVSKVILSPILDKKNNNINIKNNKKKSTKIEKEKENHKNHKNQKNQEKEKKKEVKLEDRTKSIGHILETNQVENCELKFVVHDEKTGSSAAIGSDNFLWSFTKKAVVQINPHGNKLSSMILSIEMSTLFIGTEDGKILLYSWPLGNQHYREYKIHENRINKLLLDVEERSLFSIGEDGCLFKFEIGFRIKQKNKNFRNKKKRKNIIRNYNNVYNKKNRSCSRCSETSKNSSSSSSLTSSSLFKKKKRKKMSKFEVSLEEEIKRFFLSREKKFDSFEAITFIMKNKILEMKKNIINLKEKMKQVEKDAERQTKEEEEERKRVINELETEQLKERKILLEEIESEENRTKSKEKEAKLLIKKLKFKFIEDMKFLMKSEKEMELKHIEKLKTLEIFHEEKVSKYEDELRKLKNQHSLEIHQLIEDNLNEKVGKLTGFNKIEKEFWNIISDTKKTKKKESKNYNLQIDEERYKFEMKLKILKEEKEDLLKSQKNHKFQLSNIQVEIEEKNSGLLEAAKKYQEKTDQVLQEEKKVEKVLNQIRKLQNDIDKKEKQLENQQEELINLEKLRFLLNFKYEKLLDEVQPVVDDISEVNEKLVGMKKELIQWKKKKKKLREKIEKNIDRDIVLKENLRRLKQKFNFQKKFYNFLYDELVDLVSRCVQINQENEIRREKFYIQDDLQAVLKAKLNPKNRNEKNKNIFLPPPNSRNKKGDLEVRIKLQQIIEKYEKEGSFSKSNSGENDNQKKEFQKKNTQLLEFERGRDYLEQKMLSLQKAISKKDQNYVSDIERKTNENSVLVKEINVLRQDINYLDRQIKKLHERIKSQNQLIVRFQKIVMNQVSENKEEISKKNNNTNVFLPLLNDISEKMGRFNTSQEKLKTAKLKSKRKKKIEKRKKERRLSQSLNTEAMTSVISRNKDRFNFGNVKRRTGGGVLRPVTSYENQNKKWK